MKFIILEADKVYNIRDLKFIILETDKVYQIRNI
jgi:hypothetical protein